MPRHDRQTRVLLDYENHPIAWFVTLLRDIERNDSRRIDQALAKLEQLGFVVTIVDPLPEAPYRTKGGA